MRGTQSCLKRGLFNRDIKLGEKVSTTTQLMDNDSRAEFTSWNEEEMSHQICSPNQMTERATQHCAARWCMLCCGGGN